MIGAIFIGLSGMDAFSKGLQTISNNVANIDTLGFKGDTVSFEDVFVLGGSAGLSGEFGDGGGGEGVTFAPSNIDFTQGTLQQTTNNLDLALQGSGFLTVVDPNGTIGYVRTGSFAVDSQGFITLQGTNEHLAVLDASGKPVAVNINNKETSPPAATTTVTFSQNLSSTATTDSVSNITVFDSAGGQHTWTATFAPVSGSPGQWTVTVTDESNATIGTGTINFIGGAIDPTQDKITISTTPAGADPLNVTLDFSSGVTSFSSGTTSTLAAGKVDGNGEGSLTGVTVDADGNVQLAYTNNQTVSMGSVALATFQDPQQLQRGVAGVFENSKNASVRYLASGKDGIGQLESKQLESSNVDLAQAFGDLILVQRGFQASSEVVSTANDMIQQLFGIRGRG